MKQAEFMEVVTKAHRRSNKLLHVKEHEYSAGGDRLVQFKLAAGAQGTTEGHALLGMATKHYTSIRMMLDDPASYTTQQWLGKLDDMRNYMLLLEAVLREQEVIA